MIKKPIVYLFMIFLSGLVSAQEFDFVVAKDGSGDFYTIQEAFQAVPDFRKNETKILLKPGTYKEKLVLSASKTNVSLIGENAETTLVTHDDFAQKKNKFGEEMGTTGSSSFFVFGDGFYAKNITFENSSGPVGQAVAVRVDGDQVIFEKCRFLGFQDTLYPHGDRSRQYYKDCYIEGTVDFIFGWSTAVFENCEIFSKAPSGYVTAASTDEDTEFGFVFINCKLTGDAPNNSVYLGRPWRDYAQTVFINTEMGAHIKPEGWHNWGKPNAEETSYYAEFGSTGLGANTSQRVPWSHQLTEEKAAKYTVESVLAGEDNWNPTKKIKN
ncbi:pectinesterase family protein [Algoriphagus winogradskyi]|uniref:Pectinesterase n=1 Tax=Algoriphagus winogradskyi TaxID=237017 RepID=A0ABY1P1N9_9BACT|nr:pectinesterase family protein [Algoriphagus winogradskyi]SMP23478.1 pectinesterase [Algoriphagus winogradskyi]